MTDTVNAPRERIEAFIKTWVSRSGNGNIIYGMGMEDDVLELTVSDLRAALAAAPKAEPFGLSVGTEAWPDRAPEAPKVEQEPWDYAVRYRDYGWGLASDLPADERELVLRGIPFWEVKPLYTHPAPASDELLEVLKLVDLSLQAMADEGIIADGSWSFVTDAIAKHKGPQS